MECSRRRRVLEGEGGRSYLYERRRIFWKEGRGGQIRESSRKYLLTSPKEGATCMNEGEYSGEREGKKLLEIPWSNLIGRLGGGEYSRKLPFTIGDRRRENIPEN